VVDVDCTDLVVVVVDVDSTDLVVVVVDVDSTDFVVVAVEVAGGSEVVVVVDAGTEVVVVDVTGGGLPLGYNQSEYCAIAPWRSLAKICRVQSHWPPYPPTSKRTSCLVLAGRLSATLM